jgi:hypothetical protein
MKLIASLSSSIFTEFVDLTREYESMVFSHGFKAIVSRIRETIRLRWETLQRFANRTKLRLQAIRKIVNSPTLRKSNVTQDHVRLLLKSYPNPVESLVSDIKHIFGGTDLKVVISVGLKRDFATQLDAVRFLRLEVLRLYLNIMPEHPSLKDLKLEKPTSEPTELDFDTAVRTVIKVQNALGTLKRTTIGYQKMKDYKLHGRTKSLITLFKTVGELLKKFDHIPRKSSDVGVLLSSDGQYKDTEEYVRHIRSVLINAGDYLRRAIKIQRTQEHSQQVTSLMGELLKTLDDEGC